MKTLTRFLPGGRTAGLIVALTMTATVAACSSGGESSDTSAGVANEQTSVSTNESADSAKSSGASLLVGEADASTTNVTAASDPRAPAIERRLISLGTVSLISEDVAEARRDVQRIVDGQQGAITQENTETDDEGTATYSRLVIRVPSSSFAATMLALEKSGELRKSQVKSDDVTTQVIDTEVRVRAQEASLRRVEQLLARASSLKDIIWIESQLTSRQAELDSLKSQQAYLSDQTSESTITVDIERTRVPAAKVKHEDEASGFLVGLTAGTKALGEFASSMATIVGALLPFAIVLATFGVPMWLLVRRNVRRRPRQSAAG